MLGVGNDAGPRVDVYRRNALVAKCLGHQAAGEPLAETHHHVIGPGREFTDRGQAAQDFVNRLEFVLDPALQFALAVGREQEF